MDLDNNTTYVIDTADVFQREITCIYTSRDVAEVNNTHGGLTHGVDPVQDTTSGVTSDEFYGDDITLNPVKADPAKKQTTYMIVKYTRKVYHKIIKIWCD